jgi:hypothetical protein
MLGFICFGNCIIAAWKRCGSQMTEFQFQGNFLFALKWSDRQADHLNALYPHSLYFYMNGGYNACFRTMSIIAHENISMV